jgi:hypothetical protein
MQRCQFSIPRLEDSTKLLLENDAYAITILLKGFLVAQKLRGIREVGDVSQTTLFHTQSFTNVCLGKSKKTSSSDEDVPFKLCSEERMREFWARISDQTLAGHFS